MPDNDEMIALLMLYGVVTIINEHHVVSRRDQWCSFSGTANELYLGTANELYLMVLGWMERTVKFVEDSK